MVADAQRVGNDGQGRVDRRARRKEAAVDDIQIVDLVRAAIDVERRRCRVAAEADRAVLMSGAGNRDPFAEIGVLQEQVRLAADIVEEAPQPARQSWCASTLFGR